MVVTTKKDKVTVNSHFSSKTNDEIALNMSSVMANIINRDLENMKDKETNDNDSIKKQLRYR